jgi:hypothetical protein
LGGELVSEEEHPDRWSNAEVVRAVNRLMASLDHFEEETRASLKQLEKDFAAHYVSKELLTATLVPVAEHRDRVSQWLHELVGPLVTGGLVAGIMYFVQHH